MKQLFEFEQFLMSLLAGWFFYCVASVAYSGIQIRKHRVQGERELQEVALAEHQRWIWISFWTNSGIIAIIEFVIVQQFGHRFTPLLKVHISFCVAFLLSGILACIFNGNEWSGHRVFGYVTFILSFIVMVTGIMVINLL